VESVNVLVMHFSRLMQPDLANDTGRHLKEEAPEHPGNRARSQPPPRRNPTNMVRTRSTGSLILPLISVSLVTLSNAYFFMQPQIELENPELSLAIPDPPPLAPEAPKKARRHRGNVAKLPKVLRDLVNTMLDDGAPYARIIEKLNQSTDPPLPFPISEMNISRWQPTGYQAYLARQERLDYVRDNREAALELVAGDDTTTLPEATLQIIASQYYDLLGDFSAQPLKQKLGEDPLKYTRFLNVFARLAREILNLKKYREASAKAAALELKRLDPDRELTDREDQILTDRMDDFFKKPRRNRTNAAVNPANIPKSPPPPGSQPPATDH
jgi:hypothetical protein